MARIAQRLPPEYLRRLQLGRPLAALSPVDLAGKSTNMERAAVPFKPSSRGPGACAGARLVLIIPKQV